MAINKTEYKGKIVGMLLGDASLTQNRKNALLKIRHCEKQRAYFEHKSKILSCLTSVNVRPEIARLNGKEYAQWVCETKSHPFYTKLRNHFYHNGRKTVDSHLMKLISAEGLAYWFCDDGTWWGDSVGRFPAFCTECFNRTEHDLMAYWLAKRFGLHFTVRKYRKSWRLYLRTKDVQQFTETVKPFVIDEMQYKLDFNKIGPTAAIVLCLECQKAFAAQKSLSKQRKYCSHSCQQKYLYKMGLSSVQDPMKGVEGRLRRYSLNSAAT